MSKICMLVTNSVRKDPRVRKEATSAVQAGHDVTVIGIMDSNYDPVFIKNMPFRIFLIDEINNPYKRNSIKWFFKGLDKYIKYKKAFVNFAIAENPDIIHSNDYDTLNAGYIAKKKCKCKLIYDSHEIATGSLIAEKFKLIGAFIKFNEGTIIRKADTVISVSNSAADYIAKLYSIPRPIVITNCPNYYRQIKNTPKKKFDVLYQGIMSSGRGYEEFVLSANYLHDGIQLTIRGYGEIKDQLMSLTKEINSSDKISFVKPVEIDELIPVASRSSVGVVLTKDICKNYEMTVSNKLFEYIQARLPVILSDVPEHRYLNNIYNFGIVIEKVSPEAIADAINNLADNTKLYEALKKNAISAAKELSWEAFEQKLLKSYA